MRSFSPIRITWAVEKRFFLPLTTRYLSLLKLFKFDQSTLENLNMISEDTKSEFVSRAKLSEQAERYDDMAEYMRQVTESGIGKHC